MFIWGAGLRVWGGTHHPTPGPERLWVPGLGVEAAVHSGLHSDSPGSQVAWQPLFISSPLTLKIKINFLHDVSRRAILTCKFKQPSFIVQRFMNTDVHRASFIIRKVVWRGGTLKVCQRGVIKSRPFLTTDYAPANKKRWRSWCADRETFSQCK